VNRRRAKVTPDRADSREETEIHPTGLEPVTFGSVDRLDEAATIALPSTSDNDENRVAFCVALLRREWPDLAAVVETWPTLPDCVRREIVAMIEPTDSKPPAKLRNRPKRRGK
jgi:hypothetical protein